MIDLSKADKEQLKQLEHELRDYIIGANSECTLTESDARLLRMCIVEVGMNG